MAGGRDYRVEFTDNKADFYGFRILHLQGGKK